MNRRGWVIAAMAMAVIALAALGVWTLVRNAPAQILTLSNGMQYRVAGITYGTNHIMESRWAAVSRKLPGPIEGLVRKWLGNPAGRRSTHRSIEPSLVVWLEPMGTTGTTPPQSTSVQIELADENGVLSGERDYLSLWYGTPSPPWSMSEFKAFPRRNRTLECVIFEYDYGRKERYKELGRFRFRNPAYGQFPQWTPELLPATKTAGDLKITLHSFVSGVGSSSSVTQRKDGTFYRYRPAEQGEEPGATLRFTVDSPRGTNESWTAAQFYLSDATGNRHKATSWSGSVGRPAHFSPVLWPDEKAWKLTTQFKRTSGFPKSDLVVFKDVPLPKLGHTNELHLTNVVHDIQCVLVSIVIRPSMTNHSYGSRDLTTFRLNHEGMPDDFAADLVSVTFDDPNAKAESSGSSWSDDYHESQFPVFPTNQNRATITYALQKTREVGFLVAPNWVNSTNPVEYRLEEN